MLLVQFLFWHMKYLDKEEDSMVYQQIQSELQGAKLVIVSKYRSNEQLMYYYALGHRDFAENRVQELVKKYDSLPKDICWHMIGHLQSNKVKYIVPFITMIHSVDTISLLDTIEKECKKINRKVSVCLQFNLAKEETKSGFMLDEWKEVMEYCSHLSYIDVCGIMVMGPHTDDEEAIVRVFKQAQELFVLMQGKYPQIQELSMGMSDDYPFALAHGATMIRVGSKLFENV